MFVLRKRRADSHRTEGEVLDNYVTKKRDKSATLVFMKRTLKRHGQPEILVSPWRGSKGV